MMRQRLPTTTTAVPGGRRILERLRRLPPLRRLRRGASGLWVLGALASVLGSVYCTWAFYPSSLEVQRQVSERPNSAARRDEGGAATGAAARPPLPMLRTREDRRRKRRIAWLMSFPNSGTTYTLANMETVTNRTTATNYDTEVLSDVLFPVNPGHYAAPFVFSPHLELPEYVLTKTHCVGYCDHCHHSTVTYDVPAFRFGCMRATVTRDCWTDRKFYDTGDVRKAVHLVRDPFDNAVARMHLHRELRRADGAAPAEVLDRFTDTPEGVAAWCGYIDGLFHEGRTDLGQEAGGVNPISEDTMRELRKVPCHSEWFRYAQWHNLTTSLLDEQLIERHVLYYEDYSLNLEETVERLANFLEQKTVQPPMPFVAGKTYGHLYTDEVKRAIARLIHGLVTKDTWAVLSRYLGDYLTEKEVDSARPAATSAPPKVVWLLSFPQSGAKFVSSLVETMSNCSVATNDGRKLDSTAQKVWPDVPFSPLASSPGLDQPSLVLTRTHCIGGEFSALPVENYALFSRQCGTVKLKVNKMATEGSYSSNKNILGAITLVRNPFKVINSRMKRRSQQVLDWTKQEWLVKRYTYDGLVEFCSFVDDEFAWSDQNRIPTSVSAQPRLLRTLERKLHEFRLRQRSWYQAIVERTTCPAFWFPSKQAWRRFRLVADERSKDEFEYHLKRQKRLFQDYPLSRATKEMFKDLPCHSEWFRYVQFYNYALDLTDRRPGRVFYFEQFLNGYRTVAENLIAYLRLPRRGDPIYFKKPRAMGIDLYKPHEARLAAQLVKTVGSEATWEALKHYFENEDWYTEPDVQTKAIQ